MILHITQHDIDCGMRNQANMCPIALAIKRTFPSLSSNVRVLCDGIYFDRCELSRLPNPKLELGPVFVNRTFARIPVMNSDYTSFLAEFDRFGRNGVEPMSLELKRVERPGAR